MSMDRQQNGPDGTRLVPFWSGWDPSGRDRARARPTYGSGGWVPQKTARAGLCVPVDQARDATRGAGARGRGQSTARARRGDRRVSPPRIWLSHGEKSSTLYHLARMPAYPPATLSTLKCPIPAISAPNRADPCESRGTRLAPRSAIPDRRHARRPISDKPPAIRIQAARSGVRGEVGCETRRNRAKQRHYSHEKRAKNPLHRTLSYPNVLVVSSPPGPPNRLPIRPDRANRQY